MKVKLKGCFCPLEHSHLFQRVSLFCFGLFGGFFCCCCFCILDWEQPKSSTVNILVAVLSGTVGLHLTFPTSTERTEAAFEGNFRREKSCSTFFYLHRSNWKRPVTSQTHSSSAAVISARNQKTPAVSPSWQESLIFLFAARERFYRFKVHVTVSVKIHWLRKGPI